MNSAGDFTETIRRLELAFEPPDRAHGRWRKQAVSLEASGLLRVALLSELGAKPVDEGLPPHVGTSVPELGIRSESPTRLLGVLDRAELRERVFALLGPVQTVEVRDAEVAFQLDQLDDLPALKHTLDRAVELVEAVRRALAQAPHLDRPSVSSDEGPHLPAHLREQLLKRNRTFRRGMRRWAILVGVIGALAILLWSSGHRVGAVGWVLFSCCVPIFYLMNVLDVGSPACPQCGAYLSLFSAQERCRRCDLQLR